MRGCKIHLNTKIKQQHATGASILYPSFSRKGMGTCLGFMANTDHLLSFTLLLTSHRPHSFAQLKSQKLTAHIQWISYSIPLLWKQQLSYIQSQCWMGTDEADHDIHRAQLLAKGSCLMQQLKSSVECMTLEAVSLRMRQARRQSQFIAETPSVQNHLPWL